MTIMIVLLMFVCCCCWALTVERCMQLAELLRKSSEHTLVDMIQLLFSRLPQFKEDPKWATSVRKVCCCDTCCFTRHICSGH